MLYHIYNPASPTLPSHNSACEEFISELQKQTHLGFGIVPLLGSGVSVPSGIPPIPQLSLYLQRCIAIALDVDVAAASDVTAPRWDPRRDAWPSLEYCLQPLNQKSHIDILGRWQDLLRQRKWSPELRVYQEAFGATADWRTSLSFLSRLVIDTERLDNRRTVYLADPDQNVIDSFFLKVTSGRRAGLIHRMLAHLARLLRMNIALTTNFDELLEEAFLALNHRPDVFDVHLTSGLPHRDRLREPFSIVKLHGSKYSLRGDYSLDAPPPIEDLDRFTSYLAGRSTKASATSGSGDSTGSTLENHLLICGLSAADLRVKRFVMSAMKSLPEDFKIFWLCYSPGDVAHAEQFCTQAGLESSKAHFGESKVHILRHSHHGLLLLQAYQTFAGGLPTLGAIFPTQSRLALPPQPRRGLAISPDAAFDKFTAALSARIIDVQAEKFAATNRLVICTGLPGCGATSVAATVFESLETVGNGCIWLDMNDINSSDDLFEVILDAFSAAAGNDEWLPVFVSADGKSRAKEIRRIIQSTGRRWILFLNARETPGSNSVTSTKDSLSDGESDSYLDSNGWLDQIHNPPPSSPTSTGVSFHELLEELSGQSCPDLTVVLLCRCLSRQPSHDPFMEHLTEKGTLESGFHNSTWITVNIPDVQRGNTVASDNIEQTALRSIPNELLAIYFVVMQWLSCSTIGTHKLGRREKKEVVAERNSRSHFLAALLLLQRPRYIAMFTEPPFRIPDVASNEQREKVKSYLASLEDCGLVKRKTGGFVWLHTPTRNRLRHLLFENRPELGPKFSVDAKGIVKRLQNAIKPVRSVREKIPTVHAELSEWYWKVFLSSDNPGALFESAYHSLESTRTRLFLCREMLKAASISMDAPGSANEHVLAAIAQLQHCRVIIRNATEVVRRRGFSKGSCRRLVSLYDITTRITRVASNIVTLHDGLEDDIKVFESQVQLLRIHIVGVLRDVAFEVSEFTTAYQREREILVLTVGSGDALPSISADYTARLFRTPLEGNSKQSAIIQQLIDSALPSTDDTLLPAAGPISESSLQFVAWWRRLGRLGRQSRSYEESSRSFGRIICAVAGLRRDEMWSVLSERMPRWQGEHPEALMAGAAFLTTVGDLLERATSKLEAHLVSTNEVHKGQSLDLALEYAKAAEGYCQLMLDWNSLIRRVYFRRDCTSLEFASRCISAGERIVGIIRRYVGSRSDLSNSLEKTAVRLLLHQTMCISTEECTSVERRRVVSEQHRLLDIAEATLARADPARTSILQAVLVIHRGMMHLRDAADSEFMDKQLTGVTTFDDFCRKCGEPKQAGPELLALITGSEEMKGAYRKAQRPIIATLRNAKECLDNASRALSSRRKNVFWATWYFQRMLAVIEYELWSRIVDYGEPIPFLGHSAAPGNSVTVADQCLDDSLRMVRQDSYRLATVVEYYGRVLYALHLRCRGEVYRMTDRQRNMSERFHDALQTLEVVHSRRQDRWTGGHRAALQIDDYVRRVSERGTNVLSVVDRML